MESNPGLADRSLFCRSKTCHCSNFHSRSFPKQLKDQWHPWMKGCLVLLISYTLVLSVSLSLHHSISITNTHKHKHIDSRTHITEHIQTWAHTYMNTHIHNYTHTRTHLYTHSHIHAHTHTQTHLDTHTHIDAHTHALFCLVLVTPTKSPIFSQQPKALLNKHRKRGLVKNQSIPRDPEM